MKILPILLVLFFFLRCSENNKKFELNAEIINQIQSHHSFDSLFTYKTQISFSENVLLSTPSGIIINSNNIIWSEYKGGIYEFDMKGKLLKKLSSFGDGPGEFNVVRSIARDLKSNLYVFDSAKLKIIRYDSTWSFLNSFVLRPGGFKKMAVDSVGNIYTLLEGSFSDKSTAVIKYDKNGKILGRWGEIPTTATMQEYLYGGGITIDKKSNIYYSYMSDHKILKTDSNGDRIQEWENKPSYFRETNEDEARKYRESDIINYSWKVSRVSGLFFIEPGIILQQIYTGNPKEMETVISYLELWDISGKKIISSLFVPYEVIYAFENKIVFLKEKPNQNKKLIIYEFRFK